MFSIETNIRGVKSTFTAAEQDWKVVDIEIPDIDVENDTEAIPGVPGSTFYGASVGDRADITLIFDFYCTGLSEYESKKSDIIQLFSRGQMKLFVDYVGGGRYLNVLKSGALSVNRIGFRKGRVTVLLRTVGMPFWTTETVSESFVNRFEFVYDNPSHTDLDHRFTDTEIEINVETGGNRPTFVELIVNGESWRFTGNPPARIIIKNGSAFDGNGNNLIDKITKNVLVLHPGKNDIQVRTSKNHTIIIRTRHYYY